MAVYVKLVVGLIKKIGSSMGVNMLPVKITFNGSEAIIMNKDYIKKYNEMNIKGEACKYCEWFSEKAEFSDCETCIFNPVFENNFKSEGIDK